MLEYSFRLLPLVLPWVREDKCWNINNSTHFLVTKSWHIIFSLLYAWVDPELSDQPNGAVETILPEQSCCLEVRCSSSELSHARLSHFCIFFSFFSYFLFSQFYFHPWSGLQGFMLLLFSATNASLSREKTSLLRQFNTSDPSYFINLLLLHQTKAKTHRCCAASWKCTLIFLCLYFWHTHLSVLSARTSRNYTSKRVPESQRFTLPVIVRGPSRTCLPNVHSQTRDQNNLSSHRG